ncbi:hypothetical protein FisN_15Lu360 [Fistulifera solaris]|uniref:Uncharacterized protein n=1 Tax=Fistulifera solaris TaxID=1519565 RepID=A0A1Z5JYT1_FISSO|nr:hypothetical protein FisN_15Lu360 [Fistulifera solaris]|eukprot:GAX19180.1 hypothetical protein FisN_15Lu360 [Fistulifera solaris]
MNTHIGPVYPYYFEFASTSYWIGDVRVGECPELAPVADDDWAYDELNPCIGWEKNVPAYEDAFTKWQEPACYTFTYIDPVFNFGAQPLVVRTVRNGTALSAFGDEQEDGYLPFSTFVDVWDEIYESCVRECPISGAFRCLVEYTADNENGIVYPSLLSINYFEDEFDEEVNYTISISPCGDRKPGVCVDYERIQNDFYAARYALPYYVWDMSCYTYIIQGTFANEFRGPLQVQVKDEIPHLIQAPMTDIEADMIVTFSDWMAEIEEHCIKACASGSSSEAYYNCTIEYSTEWMLPTRIVFEKNKVGDKYEYIMSNITMDICDSEPWKPPPNETQSKMTSLSPTVAWAYPQALLVFASLLSYF